MFETLRTSLIDWNQRTSERQKLQSFYLLLLVAIIFIAGLVSLFNGERSRQIIYIALVLIITYVTNVIVWALLQTFVIAKLPRSTRVVSSRTTPRPTTRSRR